MRRLALLVCACLMGASADAANDSEYQPLIDKFFVKFEAGKINEAIDEVYSTKTPISRMKSKRRRAPRLPGAATDPGSHFTGSPLPPRR